MTTVVGPDNSGNDNSAAAFGGEGSVRKSRRLQLRNVGGRGSGGGGGEVSVAGDHVGLVGGHTSERPKTAPRLHIADEREPGEIEGGVNQREQSVVSYADLHPPSSSQWPAAAARGAAPRAPSATRAGASGAASAVRRSGRQRRQSVRFKDGKDSTRQPAEEAAADREVPPGSDAGPARETSPPEAELPQGPKSAAAALAALVDADSLDGQAHSAGKGSDGGVGAGRKPRGKRARHHGDGDKATPDAEGAHEEDEEEVGLAKELKEFAKKAKKARGKGGRAGQAGAGGAPAETQGKGGGLKRQRGGGQTGEGGKQKRGGNRGTAQRHQKDHREPAAPTKPCFFWMQGRCDKGHECRFLHDGVEPSTRDTICKFFRMGNCDRGDLCPYGHDLSGEPCMHMVLHGRCTYPRCAYSHAPLEPEEAEALAEQWRSRMAAAKEAPTDAGAKAVDKAPVDHRPPAPGSSIYATNPLLSSASGGDDNTPQEHSHEAALVGNGDGGSLRDPPAATEELAPWVGGTAAAAGAVPANWSSASDSLLPPGPHLTPDGSKSDGPSAQHELGAPTRHDSQQAVPFNPFSMS